MIGFELFLYHSGAPRSGEPGIHNPSATEYEFRARAFGASRND
jgi:hypothetical protein